MFASPTLPPEPATPDNPAAIGAESEPVPQHQQESPDGPQPKKAKPSASEALARDPGKSLLPYSRVQKILKADRDLIMVQREAVFLISRATEEFVARIAEASQAVAAREGRATVQAKDLISCIRRGEEYVFLEEAIPFLEPKPGKTKDTKATAKAGDGNQDKAQPTILQHFAQSGKSDLQESQGEVFENEDGTLSGGGPSELAS